MLKLVAHEEIEDRFRGGGHGPGTIFILRDGSKWRCWGHELDTHHTRLRPASGIWDGLFWLTRAFARTCATLRILLGWPATVWLYHTYPAGQQVLWWPIHRRPGRAL